MWETSRSSPHYIHQRKEWARSCLNLAPSISANFDTWMIGSDEIIINLDSRMTNARRRDSVVPDFPSVLAGGGQGMRGRLNVKFLETVYLFVLSSERRFLLGLLWEAEGLSIIITWRMTYHPANHKGHINLHLKHGAGACPSVAQVSCAVLAWKWNENQCTLVENSLANGDISK